MAIIFIRPLSYLPQKEVWGLMRLEEKDTVGSGSVFVDAHGQMTHAGQTDLHGVHAADDGAAHVLPR